MTAEKNRSKKTVSSVIQTILVFLTISYLLISCSFPGFPKSRYEVQFDPDNEWVSESVNLKMTLQLSEQLSEDEKVFIELLDEVTGLSEAKQSFQLDKVTELEFSTDLSVPAGSVVKYRYVKAGGEYLPEGQFNGESVRYRLFLAYKDSAVRDNLYSWHGGTSHQGLGVISGCVKDKATGFPIPDILVSAGGQLTLSDANGEFVIGGIPHGEHNVLFYAMDGKYSSYQQSAIINPGLTTEANIDLHMQTPVQVIFSVIPPEEAFGAPVYIAGNILQFGNTFSGLTGKSSVFPKNMPVLSLGEDGTYSLELTLYAGTDLRYKFTLGDGYWNSEQKASGGIRTRQLIVPSQDVHLEINIESWKVPNFSPVTFRVSIPSATPLQDENFIQFRTDEWGQPIPLWPVSNAEFLYILFSPLSDQTSISYRFCRNANCSEAVSLLDGNTFLDFLPSDSEKTITTTIDTSIIWQMIGDQNNYPIPPTPINPQEYITSIELSPQMDPSWTLYAPAGIEAIAEMGTKSIIFSPPWFLRTTPPLISEKIGLTPFTFELKELLTHSNSTGLNHSLYPQLASDVSIESWWLSQVTSSEWWEEWFRNYRKFILNYATIAEDTGAEQLILGGKATIPTFIGGFLPDGSETNAPEFSDGKWQDLIRDIRNTYSGKIIWATNVNQRVDPLPEFITQFDGIYVIIDSPLSNTNNASFEEIAISFTSVIDNFIYEIYRSTQIPLFIGLGYPSVDGAARGCTILRETCYNDGLFFSYELGEEKLDLDEQALIYSSILPVVASRNWITGTIIRGYLPTVIIQNGSSSIAGKPASMVISDWFRSINNAQD